MSRPDATDLFHAMADHITAGFDEMSLHAGMIYVGENVFDAHAILRRLLRCADDASPPSARVPQPLSAARDEP